jgi:molybdopterin-guanine dinucleotide biosynthesis protein A
MIKRVEEYISKGGYSIHQLVKELKCVFIEEKIARKYSPNWNMFINFNTKEDVETYLKENEMEL